MTTNQFFTKYNNPIEQDLLQDLIIEATQRYGTDVYYLPRIIADQSDIFGEDPLGMFDTAVEIEVYVKSVENWGGEGDILTNVGLSIKDRITFTISQFRWDQQRTEKVLMEDGQPVVQESSDTSSPLTANYNHLLLEAGTANGYSLSSRPLEGDLIYSPLVDKIFVIQFVEHEDLFYQMGKLMTYDLICEKWDYSSERLNTGVTNIDAIETKFSADMTNYRVVQEDGTAILQEDGISYIIKETGSSRIEDIDLFANNETLEIKGDDFIDFSEKHPFQWGATDY